MTVLNSTNWMQGIDDDTSISAMSIPGTHDSGARYGGGPTQCQELEIADQLRRGIRFLDIRCAYAVATLGGDFPVYHGGIYQYLDFEKVQSACTDFLTAHPSEFIMMNVQQEQVPNLHNKSSDEFRDKFMSLYDPDYWAFPETIPTLGDCRKKIVLIRSGWPRMTGKSESGLEWNGFGIDGTSSNAIFDTQNGWSKYNVGTWDQQNTAKADAVKEYMTRAATRAAGDKIYLNFLSRAAGAYVGTAAEAVNIEIADYLRTTTESPLGVLPLDFTGNTGWSGSLEEQITNRNALTAGSSVAFPMSPFKLALSVPGQPSDEWWMSEGEHGWAISLLPVADKAPTGDDPMILELYTYKGEEYYKVPGVESYLSVSNAGQVGLYDWHNARTFSQERVTVTVGDETFEIVCLISNDNGFKLRRHSNGELWCDELNVGDLLSVTFVPA